MIDEKFVQNLIETEIGFDFEIDTWDDSDQYIIIFWKHKSYSSDDERGQYVGRGPVIYFKDENQYRVLSSGEWFYGDYANHLDPKLIEETRYKHDFVMDLFEGKEKDEKQILELINDIKVGILKRDYVNTDDIDSLCILFGARVISNSFDMVFNPNYPIRKHVMVVFNNKEAYKKIIAFWDSIGGSYDSISETELVLFKEL